jgi:transposase
VIIVKVRGLKKLKAIERGYGNKGRKLDKFDFMNISNERKRQLRKAAKNICIRSCKNIPNIYKRKASSKNAYKPD